MKAVVQETYGSPEVLEFRVVDTPVAGDDEVLVQVCAAAVNAYDWHLVHGDPYLARLAFGVRAPRRKIRGRDFAGRVVAVGRDVTGFAPGDEVFGDLGERNGAFAEYVAVPRNQVARKPANLTFEQSAAIPLAGNTALMGLRDVADVQPGHHVLVNGASGGCGTFAVQLAKAFGARVTAVCSTRNVDTARALGADDVVDYTRRDFTRTGERYDVVFDLVGNHGLAGLRRALTPDGVLVLSGGGVFTGGSLVGPLGLILRSVLAAPFSRQRMSTVVDRPSGENLATLRELVESGQVTPVIDRTYPLSEVPEAIRYLAVEHARAKVVITVG